MLLPRVHLQCQNAAIALVATHAQGRLNALGQALLQVSAHLHPVYHHVNVVLLGLLERRQVLVFIDLPIDPKADVAQRLHLRKQLGELAFLLPRHGGHHHEFGVLGQGQHGVHHLAHRLRGQRQTVVRAERRACTGIQQAQVVVDLGHRAHGGARVVAGGLLLNADGGRQAFDQVNIGLVQPPQKLPRIGRQALHIAPLALGIERVKRQAGFARARQPRDHHQLVARNVQVDVLEVVRARPPDADALLAQGAGEVDTIGGSVIGNRGRGHGRARCRKTHHDRRDHQGHDLLAMARGGGVVSPCYNPSKALWPIVNITPSQKRFSHALDTFRPKQ